MPIALTSHIMNVMERLVEYLRSRVCPSQDFLQFKCQSHVGVADAINYLLREASSSLDRPPLSAFFDFSRIFNTIQPRLLKAKLENMRVDSPLITWVNDYLTGRQLCVRLQNCVSDNLIGNIGVPQVTVLSAFLFTTYAADFKYYTELCHLQTFSDDTAIVGHEKGGREDEQVCGVGRTTCGCWYGYVNVCVIFITMITQMLNSRGLRMEPWGTPLVRHVITYSHKVAVIKDLNQC